MIFTSFHRYFINRIFSLKYFLLIQFLVFLNFAKYIENTKFNFFQFYLSFLLLFTVWRLVDDYFSRHADAQMGRNYFEGISTIEILTLFIVFNSLLLLAVNSLKAAVLITIFNILVITSAKLAEVYSHNTFVKNFTIGKYSFLPILTTLTLSLTNLAFGLLISLSVLSFDYLEPGSEGTGQKNKVLILMFSLTTAAFYFSTIALPISSIAAMLMLLCAAPGFERVHFLWPYLMYFVLLFSVIEEKFIIWN